MKSIPGNMEWDVGVTSRGQALTRASRGRGEVEVAVGSGGQAGDGSEQVDRTAVAPPTS